MANFEWGNTRNDNPIGLPSFCKLINKIAFYKKVASYSEKPLPELAEDDWEEELYC